MTEDAQTDALNRYCHCINVNRDALRQSLDTRLGEAGAWSRLQDTHPHLLANSPVFVAHDHVAQIRAIVKAVEHVASLPAYRDLVLDWAPEIARRDPGTHGVFFGYDFHLTNDGPRLIEINTNAGGALLLMHVANAQQACCEEVENFVTGKVETPALEPTFVEMFRQELRLRAPGKALRRVAIVDECPEQQYLRPEFTLFEQMFEHHGIDALVVGPEAFSLEGQLLKVDGKTVDLVYNRLTDFYLQQPACATLRRAYEENLAVITPSPFTHAVYANKRNLALLCDEHQLKAMGVRDAMIKTLVNGVPRAEVVTRENADDLWSRRKRLFFKPNCGFGSRGAYDGRKLTKKTWASILGADYIAQELVAPSERLIVHDGDRQAMKLDVRCYTYAGEIQLLGARLYRGQTTNFRTGGGGLAAVFTAPGF